MHKDPLLDVLLHILVVVDAILAKGEFTGVQGADPYYPRTSLEAKGKEYSAAKPGDAGGSSPLPPCPPKFSTMNEEGEKGNKEEKERG